MPISPDVMELVQLLDEEGFGALAGELLTEISLGREIDSELGGRSTLLIKAIGVTERLAETPTPREPISTDKQLLVAIDFLRLRLIEPVRRLAEAEMIAGSLNTYGPTSAQRFEAINPIRIIFTRFADENGAAFERSEEAGNSKTADALEQIFVQLVQESK